MVEKFCMTVTSRLIDEELISDSQADIYTYELQMIVESLLAHTLLLLLASISGCFLKVCVFVISFDMLRQFSGGYHCKTFKGCCFLSLLVTLMIITLENMAIELWAICQGGGDNINDFCHLYWSHKSPRLMLVQRRICQS